MTGTKLNRVKRKAAGHVLMCAFHAQLAVNAMVSVHVMRECSSGLTDKEVAWLQKAYERGNDHANHMKAMGKRLCA